MTRPVLVQASRIALLLAALGAGQAQAGLFDDDEARRQLAEFKAKAEANFDTQAKAQLQLESSIQQQAEEIARLRGEIETLNYELETAKKRQQDYYLDLDTRLRKLEPQPAASAAANGGEAPAKAPAETGDPAAEDRDYQAALGLMRGGKYKEAGAAFSSFVQKYPASSLAPNAQFWLGNAWRAQHDCRKAIEAESYVATKWPTSDKAPDAMLVMADCQQEMGNPTGARRTLESLVAKYPNSAAAENAKPRLKKK